MRSFRLDLLSSGQHQKDWLHLSQTLIVNHDAVLFRIVNGTYTRSSVHVPIVSQ